MLFQVRNEILRPIICRSNNRTWHRQTIIFIFQCRFTKTKSRMYMLIWTSICPTSTKPAETFHYEKKRNLKKIQRQKYTMLLWVNISIPSLCESRMRVRVRIIFVKVVQRTGFLSIELLWTEMLSSWRQNFIIMCVCVCVTLSLKTISNNKLS